MRHPGGTYIEATILIVGIKALSGFERALGQGVRGGNTKWEEKSQYSRWLGIFIDNHQSQKQTNGWGDDICNIVIAEDLLRIGTS